MPNGLKNKWNEKLMSLLDKAGSDDKHLLPSIMVIGVVLAYLGLVLQSISPYSSAGFENIYLTWITEMIVLLAMRKWQAYILQIFVGAALFYFFVGLLRTTLYASVLVVAGAPYSPGAESVPALMFGEFITLILSVFACRYRYITPFLFLVSLSVAVMADMYQGHQAFIHEARNEGKEKTLNALDVYSFIDKAGTAAIQIGFEDAHPFCNGLAPVKMGGSWHLIDRRGEVKKSLTLDDVHDLPKVEVANAPLNTSLEFRNLIVQKLPTALASRIINPEFLSVSQTSEGLSCVTVSVTSVGVPLCFLVNGEGNLVSVPHTDPFHSEKEFEAVYLGVSVDRLGSFHENLCPARLCGKWGYIDRGGRFVIQPLFDYADSFSEGLAVVRSR